MAIETTRIKLGTLMTAGTFRHPGVLANAVATVDQMSDWLLDRWGLATVPGSAFGDNTCIRLSFAASEAELDEGLTRLEQGLRSLV